MRGKRIPDRIRRLSYRLIPACAGKTDRRRLLALPLSAHPRVCGENHCSRYPAQRTAGSSPRVRGKLSSSASAVASRRLIPACAGKTGSISVRTAVPRAHPRVCGENFLSIVLSCRLRGSSPRVRGKPRYDTHHMYRLGLIPACAGKTDVRCDPSRKISAHPRVCGENEAHCFGRALGIGSSPRVRGKRRAIAEHPHKPGLIPACAGKTSPALLTSRGARAHPRVCGENAICDIDPVAQEGSSPRVRGKP